MFALRAHSAHHPSTIRAETTSVRPAFAEQANRIRAEYLEIPGLHLTMWQAQRLWNLEADVCEALLGAFVDVGFLRQTARGGFVCADAGGQ